MGRQEKDRFWMQRALQLGTDAASHGEVPVGAVIVSGDALLAEGANNPISGNDPTGHAEIIALRAAARKMGNYRLPGTTLYVTLEPCIMCMGAMIHGRIDRLVYGATDPKTGAATSLYQIGTDTRLNHTLTVEGGVLEDKCAELLKTFFKNRRAAHRAERGG